MADVPDVEARQRKHSIGAVEVQDRHGDVRTVALEELSDADRALAIEFGYKPVFKREFGWLSTFSFAVSISGVFSTVATTFIYPLEAGGSASVVWCWLISGAGAMCIACSVSELVSAYPTCGGLYYTVSRLAPPKYIASISWLTGWLNLLGQVAGIASSEWGAASLLLAAVSIGTDFNYLPTVNHTVGVMAALTVITGFVNSLSTYWMEKMTKTYVIFHVLVLVSCCIALLAMSTPDRGSPKNSPSYVFTDISNTSGWTPNGWSFLFGFLSASYVLTDEDASAHLAEEIRNPEIKAPWAISLAMAFTYISGWLFNIVLCFTMGDISPDNPNSILASVIQQPVSQIFYNVLGKGGSITFTVCAFIILKFVTFTAMQALARTVFAFSRDRLLPLSNVWTQILPLTGTPINAVWISVFWCIAINLIGLGSYTAIVGVFNVCAIAIDWSYCIPIICKLAFGKFKPGPWHMGRFSVLVNCWAVLWTAFVSVIFLMPTIRPVTPDNMNYAVVYLFAILFFSMLYWYTFGHRFYTGPVVQVNLGQDVSPSRGSDEDEATQFPEKR